MTKVTIDDLWEVAYALSISAKINNTIQYNRIICNAHKVEYRTSNLRRGQSLGGRGCGRWLTGMRCEECF